MSTVLVTGGTGYVGSWVVKELLEKGHTVRLAARDKSKEAKFKHLSDIAGKASGNLEVFEANLLNEGSYDEAAKGSDAIIHIASPFFLKVKDPQKELVDPALKGTQNVLSAASKSKTVKKVVLTSSVASILGDSIDMQNQGLTEFDESHWNTTSSLKHQPYSYSKVLAEKDAWRIEAEQNDWKLVVINPGFVLGPSLTTTTSSESLNVMRDMLSGKFKTGAADLWFGMIDVRDAAHAHVLAFESDTAEGRHITCNGEMNFLDIANSINKSYPNKYNLPKRLAPKGLLMLMGWMFGITRKFVKLNVGYPIKLNNSKIKSSLAIDFTDLDVTIKDMVAQMEEQKLV